MKNRQIDCVVTAGKLIYNIAGNKKERRSASLQISRGFMGKEQHENISGTQGNL